LPLVSSPLVETVIGHAISVHRLLGPGLFESVYEQCFEHELDVHGIRFRRQVPLSLTYRTLRIDCAYRVDLIVEDELLVELKSIERLLPLHHTQALTYLKLSGCRQALLINFNVRRLADGVKSFLAKSRHEGNEGSEGHEEEDPSKSPS
jgi:GxxExxY protein